MKRMVVIAMLALALSALPAQAKLDVPVGIQVGTYDGGETSGLWTGWLYSIPHVRWWLPDVFEASFAQNGETDDTVPHNVAGLGAWWTPGRSDYLDIGFGAGGHFANFAVQNSESSFFYGGAVVVKFGEQRLGLWVTDETQFDDLQLELTARAAFITPWPL